MCLFAYIMQCVSACISTYTHTIKLTGDHWSPEIITPQLFTLHYYLFTKKKALA